MILYMSDIRITSYSQVQNRGKRHSTGQWKQSSLASPKSHRKKNLPLLQPEDEVKKMFRLRNFFFSRSSPGDFLTLNPGDTASKNSAHPQGVSLPSLKLLVRFSRAQTTNPSLPCSPILRQHILVLEYQLGKTLNSVYETIAKRGCTFGLVKKSYKSDLLDQS